MVKAKTGKNISLFAQMQRHHQIQLDLCKRLEKLADDLPEKIDSQECIYISWQLYPVVRSAHHFEETHFFPLLEKHQNDKQTLENSIERLKFEHWEDESFAEDLSLQLRELVSDPKQVNVEKVSYMLRGFFEGLRRHIAFETEYLLPMIQN